MRVFEHVEQGMNTEPGKPSAYEDGFPTGEFYAEWVDDRHREPPGRRHHRAWSRSSSTTRTASTGRSRARRR